MRFSFQETVTLKISPASIISSCLRALAKLVVRMLDASKEYTPVEAILKAVLRSSFTGIFRIEVEVGLCLLDLYVRFDGEFQYDVLFESGARDILHYCNRNRDELRMLTANDTPISSSYGLHEEVCRLVRSYIKTLLRPRGSKLYSYGLRVPASPRVRGRRPSWFRSPVVYPGGGKLDFYIDSEAQKQLPLALLLETWCRDWACSSDAPCGYVGLYLKSIYLNENTSVVMEFQPEEYRQLRTDPPRGKMSPNLFFQVSKPYRTLYPEGSPT